MPRNRLRVEYKPYPTPTRTVSGQKAYQGVPRQHAADQRDPVVREEEYPAAAEHSTCSATLPIT
jgi:hypothetical protein